MRLNENDISELIEIHREVKGEVLSRSEARDMGENLVRLGMILAGLGYPQEQVDAAGDAAARSDPS